MVFCVTRKALQDGDQTKASLFFGKVAKQFSYFVRTSCIYKRLGGLALKRFKASLCVLLGKHGEREEKREADIIILILCAWQSPAGFFFPVVIFSKYMVVCDIQFY